MAETFKKAGGQIRRVVVPRSTLGLGLKKRQKEERPRRKSLGAVPPPPSTTQGTTSGQGIGAGHGKVAQDLSLGAARSGSIKLYLPKLLKGDLSPGFKAAHLKKDLAYAVGEANRRSLFLPAASLALELYKICEEGSRGVGGSTRWVRCI